MIRMIWNPDRRLVLLLLLAISLADARKKHGHKAKAVLVPTPAPVSVSDPASYLSASLEEGVVRVLFDQRVSDPKDPGRGDFQDCPKPGGPCLSGLVLRFEPDERVTDPPGLARDGMKFLTLKGYHMQGRDPITTIALYQTGDGDSVLVDQNGDEDLGNDTKAWFWKQKEACVEVDASASGIPPFTLCRAGSRAKAWRERCETLKTSISWADCDTDPVKLEVRDVVQGKFRYGSRTRLLGAYDADGDGRFRYHAGDRILVDWNGDGVLEKSLDGDGFALVGPDQPFRFSLESETYSLNGIDSSGAGVELRRLDKFEPSARLFKPVEGKPAPDIRFVNLDGDTMKISDFKGKKVLINFWSTLCKPCLEGFGELKQFNASFSSKNWVVISLTTDRELDMVQQAYMNYKMDWMVGMAGPEARNYYLSHGLPLNFKINADGILEKMNVPLGKRPH